ncbi:MAG: zinc-ribbon domain-containing protein [Gemmatimonadaceae bacterium]
MTVSCPDCRSVFRVDPAKVPASGVRARCSVCGGVIAIAGGTLPVMVTSASAGVVQSAFATPAESSRAVAASPTPPAPAMRYSPPQPSEPVPTPTPAPRPTAAVIAAVATRIPTPPSTPVATSASATPSGNQQAVGGATDAPKRPINPFLKADPGQRARRLARALVSDLVAYHPQKRDEGIRNGTLRQLFREEIKKSYEEYVEQVGRELAEATPHFQEALNDILGGGRKLF